MTECVIFFIGPGLHILPVTKHNENSYQMGDYMYFSLGVLGEKKLGNHCPNGMRQIMQ